MSSSIKRQAEQQQIIKNTPTSVNMLHKFSFLTVPWFTARLYVLLPPLTQNTCDRQLRPGTDYGTTTVQLRSKHRRRPTPLRNNKTLYSGPDTRTVRLDNARSRHALMLRR